MVPQQHFNPYIGFCGIGQGEAGPNKRVFNGNSSGGSQVNIVPYTCVTAPDGRDPVPSHGSMEGGVVCAQDPAVLIRADRVLFLYGAHVIVFDDLHRQYIALTGKQKLRDIEFSPDESAFHPAGICSVNKQVRFPINTIEVQEDLFFSKVIRNKKFPSIPKI